MDEPKTVVIPGYITTTNMMKPIGMFWHAQMAYYAPQTVGDTFTGSHVVMSSPLDFNITRVSEMKSCWVAKPWGNTKQFSTTMVK